MIRLEKAVWATRDFVGNDEHIRLIRELAAYHVMCPQSFRMIMDVGTGELRESEKNSAMHWSRSFEWPWAILNADLTGTETCLDAGGGHAVLQYAMARRAAHVTNMDLDEMSLSASEDMAHALGVSKKLCQQRGDIRLVSKITGPFDRVFCISVLEHLEDWQETARELFHVVRPGGKAIFTIDVDTRDRNPDLINRKTITDWLENTFGARLPSDNGALSVTMPSGAYLQCLCLKFVKEGR